MYRFANIGIIFLFVLCISPPSIAFCPVSFIPGGVSCIGGEDFKWTLPKYPSDLVNSNSQKIVSISGGCPPYSWSVSGEGYWLENDLTYSPENIVYTDSTIDCLATITVADKFGHRVTGSLRRSGSWVNIGSRCDVPGPATKHLGYSQYYKWQFERVVGRYRQYQTYSTRNYFSGTCLWNEPPCGNQPYSCRPSSNPGMECITLESTGLIDGFDNIDYPCVWQSPEAWSEATGSNDHSYCTNLGAIGWTSMVCVTSAKLRLEEWRCD